MKQLYLIHEHHPRLLLFFAGWGADETPFRHYHPAGSDYMICYDYRSLQFDPSLLDNYREIHVVGWSMGVWAAARVVPPLALPIGRTIALNGTPYQMDDRRGIPEAIFRGTLEGLNGVSLHKFLRRMCSDTAAFRRFLEVSPHRPLEELREELAATLQREEAQQPLPDPSFFREAFIGANDRIIPPANQRCAWEEAGAEICLSDEAHYTERIFKHYLEEIWTND